MLKIWIVSLACLGLVGGAASADWKSHYRAYEAALADGAEEEATRAAEAAWRSAAEVLGPSENLALLAQNFAVSALFGQPEKAEEALAEAVTLARAGYGTSNFSLPTLRFFEAFSRSQAQPQRWRLARRAGRAALSVPETDLTRLTTIQAFNLLATRQVEHGFALEVPAYMRGLREALLKAGNVAPSVLASVEAVRLAALLKNSPDLRGRTGSRPPMGKIKAFTEELENTIITLRTIAQAYPTQTSIDGIDEELAYIATYDSVAHAFLNTYQTEGETEEFEEALPPLAIGPLRPASCGEISWERKKIRFPKIDVGYNGAVMIGYHLDEDGNVYGQRILAEVPARRFGDSVLNQMEDFRADPDIMDEACLRDHILFIRFSTRL